MVVVSVPHSLSILCVFVDGALTGRATLGFLWLGVGKTALTTRFQQGQFSGDYDPTIEGRFSSDCFSRRFASLALYGIDAYRKQAVIDDEVAMIDILDTGAAMIDILDTPGQEAYTSVLDQLRSRYSTKSLRFFPPTAFVPPLPCFIVSDVISCRPLVEQYLRVGEGFLLVYSTTSRESFEATNRLHQQILQVRDKANVPILLIGNKCDLEYERQVGMNGE